MSITITVDGTDYDVPSSASDTNWAANQVAWEQAVTTYVTDTATDLSELTTLITTQSWTAATLINSWASGGPVPGFWKDPSGTVHLRGGLTGGVSATVAFVLPSGSRPAAATILLGAATSGAFTAAVAINGNVTITNLTAGADVATFASLAGLSFTTAA